MRSLLLAFLSIFFHTIFITILSFHNSKSLYIGSIKPLYVSKVICEDSKFYQPYVKIFNSRFHEYIGRSPLAVINNAGFMDLRNYSGIMCINGPAFLYLDIVSVYDITSTVLISEVFTTAHVKIYSHQCFSFNRLKRNAYKTGNTWVDRKTQVFGNKFYGVYLLGKEGDYRQFDFVFFHEPDFGYGKDRIILDGASLACVINSSETNSLCYHIEALNVDGLISGDFVNEPLFCLRKDNLKDFDIPWHSNIVVDEVEWGSCGEGKFTPINNNELENKLEEYNDFIDFMLHIPKITVANPKHRQKNTDRTMNQTVVKLRKISMLDSIWKFPFEFHKEDTFSDNMIAGTNSPKYKRYLTQFSSDECSVIPKPNTAEASCQPMTEAPCAILNHILTLETVDWKAGRVKEGGWRKFILDLVSQMYAKMCPQVPTIFVEAITRIFEYFLNKSIDTSSETSFQKPRRKEWNEIELDLENCHKYSDKLPFTRVQDSKRVKRKQLLERELTMLTSYNSQTEGETNSSDSSKNFRISQIVDELNTIYLRFPYKIILKDLQGNRFEMRDQQDYVEAAEIDYNLDWAIDSFWKVISTVIGYCYVHYRIPDSGTLVKVYNFFNDDFFEYVKDTWIHGLDFDLYSHLLGEFIHGPASLYIDSCNNGAYHWAGIIFLRPLRPLYLMNGEESYANTKVKNTPFVKPIPNFYTINVNFKH